MAIMTVPERNSDGASLVNLDAVWDLYQASGFLYPAKQQRLDPALAQIQAGWPRLLAAPAELFQLHTALASEQLISSVSAFRDTDDTYVIQHAVSRGQPRSMLECLHSVWATLGTDPRARFAGFFYRPENRWPSRLEHMVSNMHPAHLTTRLTREYLVCRPKDVAAGPRRPIGGSSVVEQGDAKAGDVITEVMNASIEPMLAASMSINKSSLALPALDEQYQSQGLRRSRQAVAVLQQGVPAGVALTYSTNVPMNFSFLCQRSEIIVSPHAPDGERAARLLARTVINQARQRPEAICPLLIDAAYVPAAVAEGFQVTGKRYAYVVWARENEAGWPAAFRAVQRMYRAVN